MSQNDDKKKTAARIGIGTKGFVYCIIGGLTAWAAFGTGGQKTGSSGVLSFLASQPFGKVLLSLTALGLAGYVFWRMLQAFGDPEDKGSDKEGVAKRIGYFFSGLFYGFLLFNAVQLVLGNGGGSGGGNGSGGGGQEFVVGKLLNQPWGRCLVGLLALIFLGKALYQMYRAYSGKFKKKIQEAGLDQRVQKVLVVLGKVGYTARGIVIGLVAYLIFRAALTYDADKAGGTKEAFSFLQNEFGNVVLGIIALGLLAYGIFMFIKAKERYFEMD